MEYLKADLLAKSEEVDEVKKALEEKVDKLKEQVQALGETHRRSEADLLDLTTREKDAIAERDNLKQVIFFFFCNFFVRNGIKFRANLDIFPL